MNDGSAERAPGRLYLVPSALDFGMPVGQQRGLDEVLPLGVIRVAAGLSQWVCESAKTTRAFLKRVDAIVALSAPLQDLTLRELPRPAKGSAHGKSNPREVWLDLLAPALQGLDVGVSSEAGLPAVADPGSELVRVAHELGVSVVALPGPSSLLLALAASGLQGQSFAFVGYLPVDAAGRIARIRDLEAVSRRLGQTQLMIETPYRNPALLAALLAALAPTTRLSLSCGLTFADGFNRSDPVARWRQRPSAMPTDRPTVFSLLAAG